MDKKVRISFLFPYPEDLLFLDSSLPFRARASLTMSRFRYRSKMFLNPESARYNFSSWWSSSRKKRKMNWSRLFTPFINLLLLLLLRTSLGISSSSNWKSPFYRVNCIVSLRQQYFSHRSLSKQWSVIHWYPSDSLISVRWLQRWNGAGVGQFSSQISSRPIRFEQWFVVGTIEEMVE